MESQEKAPMGGSLCEVEEDGKSKWGTKMKEDWKELGVRSIGGWCNKVKDRGWLASKLGESKKKGKGKKTQDSRT